MSTDENSNSSEASHPLPHNGGLSSIGNQDPLTGLTDVSVSQQVIRPWQDMLLANMDMQKNQRSSRTPERAGENRFSGDFNQASCKISPGTKSVEACANKQQHSSIEQVDYHTREARIEERESSMRKVSRNNSTSRRSCSVTREHIGGSCHSHRVVIDFRELVEVYTRVVKDTGDCSVEQMEHLHATFEQLVFRHRMHWDREALLMVCFMLSGCEQLYDIITIAKFVISVKAAVGSCFWGGGGGGSVQFDLIAVVKRCVHDS